MAKYRLTVKAVEDLSLIWDYTFETWSENQADKYYDLLVDNFNLIAEKPFLGKDYSIIKECLLGFLAAKHIIFYRKIADNEIEIIRILHQQMDLKNIIQEK